MRSMIVKRVLGSALSLSFAIGLTSPAQATVDMSKKGGSIAYAKLSVATGSVVAFGGKGTAQASSSGGGFWTVTFTGKYPEDITADHLILQSSCQSFDYGVANSYVQSASPTEIVVGIYCWKSDTLLPDGGDAFVNVFFGRLP